MSSLQVDIIRNRQGNGAPEFDNGLIVTGIITSANINSNNLSIGSTEVISSSFQLKNILSLDSITLSTLESALEVAPNTFNSLLISSGGISTFTGNVFIAGVTSISNNTFITGNLEIDGNISANNISGNLDYSFIQNATIGVRTEISATTSNLGSLNYDNQTGIFEYIGVTTSTIRDQFSSSSSDIGSLNYDNQTGIFSLSGVTTAIIRDQFNSGTGVFISNGEISIGQSVGTSDDVTFSSINSLGISTVGSLYINSNKVISVEGSNITLSNIDEIDEITRLTLESALSLDPNDFNSLNVSGITTLSGYVNIDNSVDIFDDLNVSGVSTLGTAYINAGEIDVSRIETGDLNVSGVSTLGTAYINAGEIDVSRIETGDLNVSGITTLSNLDVNGYTSINETLEVIGVSTFNSSVNINDGVLVSGIVTASGGFTSVGNTTPIQISLVGNQLTFTAVGIGSTTLTLV
jgi:hypothetical protein